MKHSLHYMAASLMLFTACSTIELVEPEITNEPETNTPAIEREAVDRVVFIGPAIKSEIDGVETKSTLIPLEDKIRFGWEVRDTVGIYPDKGSQVYFSMADGVGSNVATFDGGGWALRQNSIYSSYYPFVGNMYLDRDNIPVSFKGQKQTGTTTYDNTRFFLASQGTSSDDGELRFTFEMLNTIIMVNTTLPAGTYSRISLIAEEALFTEEGSYSLEKRAIIGKSFTESLDLTLENFNLKEQTTVQVYLTTAPIDLRGKNITVRFYTTDGKSFSCVKSPTKAYNAGVWYGLNCDLKEDVVELPYETEELNTPLTFQALENGIIYITNPLELTIEYLKDNIWFKENDGDIRIPISAGESISFRGDNNSYGESYYYENDLYSINTEFYVNVDCFVYGNIMSLISSSNFSHLTSVSENCFFGLFNGNNRIKNHPTKDILLPATKLATNCYRRMFENCSSLTKTPILPATTLASTCYYSMFNGCSSLITIPAKLPATTLVGGEQPEGCYSYMFEGCTSLTTAPELPATTLAPYCYDAMFSGCTSLTTAPELPATELQVFCYSSMFEGCTSLTTAPELHAEQLVDECYISMFSGCTSLKYIKCFAIYMSSDGDTLSWMENVSSTGTFVKSSKAKWDIAGENGIPNGWIVEYE